MNRFAAFVKKELLHIIRDYRTVLILFLMPVIQLLLFGYVISNEIKDIRTAVYDPSRDEVSREITDKIFSSGFFILDRYLESNEHVERIFREGDIRQVIVFEEDFAAELKRSGEAGIQLLADASDANTANLIVNYTTGIINDYLQEYNMGKGSLMIAPEVRMFYNENLKSAYMFVPGTMALILIILCAMMTSISIAREKESGTMEALLVSPLKPVQIIIGKVTPYILLSFINAGIVIAMGTIVFKMPVKGSLSLLLFETMLFISLSLSIGIMISTMAKTQQVAMFVSVFILLLPTMLLSGFIFPIENMHFLLQWLASVFPTRYFITILKNIMLKGTGLLFVWKETLVLTGMLVLFIVISVIKFKNRLN